ncbi:MAG: lactate utilization protein [Deltaproteobacteria bacterium]|nr:lactate utilization protein [Deltaproteobacteria bacterium]
MKPSEMNLDERCSRTDFWETEAAKETRPTFLRWLYEKKAAQVVWAMQNKESEIETAFFPTVEECRRRVLELTSPSETVSIPGTVTIRQMGILTALQQRGNQVYDLWKPGQSPEEKALTRRTSLTSDVLITSANAVTLDGEIFNIDGSGNRVAGMIFGPKRVFVIVGGNKLVRDLSQAVYVTKNYSAPAGNKERNDRTNPCSKTGVCIDCRGKVRGCRVTVIVEYKPRRIQDYYLFIVGEDLGF